jgi:uncharacterized membrane protein YciS (DUF1049 family)
MALDEEQSEQSGEKSPRILRGRVDSFAIYEITDDELRTLESGSPSSLLLNLAIFCISTAAAFLIALLTTSGISIHLFTVFTVITTVGFFGGAILVAIWIRTRVSLSSLVRRIRARIPTSADRSSDEE